jgi:hypothetical protein
MWRYVPAFNAVVPAAPRPHPQSLHWHDRHRPPGVATGLRRLKVMKGAGSSGLAGARLERPEELAARLLAAAARVRAYLAVLDGQLGSGEHLGQPRPGLCPAEGDDVAVLRAVLSTAWVSTEALTSGATDSR